jgi:hypothetical protein
MAYGLPFPDSISETATIPDKTASLLPFCMGSLALFSLCYSLKYSYDDKWYKLDRLLPLIMAIGFTLVAAQPCASPYLTADRVGLFLLTQEASHIVHCAGAIGGFGVAILWVLLCFTKSDKPKAEQSAHKRIRNNVYGTLGLLMIGSLSIFVADRFTLFGEEFAAIFYTEWALCMLFAPALAIKGGMFNLLRSKKVQQ